MVLESTFCLQDCMAGAQLLSLHHILDFRAQEVLDLLSFWADHNYDSPNASLPQAVDYMGYHGEPAYLMENLWECRLHAGTFPRRQDHRRY